MLLHQRLQNRLLHPRRLHKRRVRLDHSPALLQPRRNLLPRTPRVQLILTHRDPAAAAGLDVLLQLVQMADPVVRHPDRPDLAAGLLLRLDEGAPGAQAAVFAAVGGVDEYSGVVSSTPIICMEGSEEYRSI